VQDNEYAISVPVEVQTAGGNISRLVSGFPNFHFEEIDGTDPVVAYAAFKRASLIAARATGRRFHAHVIRPYSHSLSDDERLYRPGCRASAGCRPRPGARACRCSSSAKAFSTKKGINRLEKQVDDDLQAAVDHALAGGSAGA
jgi:2-oxoisovalerate dehydrogenase E1 component